MDLADAAAALYGVVPTTFVAQRTEKSKEARAAGEKDLARDIGRLPKPSAAAWAANALVRRRPEAIARVVELGGVVRAAQEAFDAARLRELATERRVVLAAVVRDARGLAEELGTALSDAAAAELEQTLHAALADPWAAEALRSGLLVRSLSSNGFEPVDLTGAVAVPKARTAAVVGEVSAPGRPVASDKEERRRLTAERERERREAEEHLLDAERSVARTRAELAEAESGAAEAASLRAALAAELDGVRTRLASLEQELEDAGEQAAHAERVLSHAARLAEEADQAADRARERLAGLDAAAGLDHAEGPDGRELR